MPKRTRRTSSRPKAAGGSRARATTLPARVDVAQPKHLLYKVVELSSVDEASLEETVNAHVRMGWSFDGVQFAMRESSKRPSMAFVFFTRTDPAPRAEDDATRPGGRRLKDAGGSERSAGGEKPFEFTAAEEIGIESSTPPDEARRTWGTAPRERSSDPWVRLAQLADEADEGGEDER